MRPSVLVSGSSRGIGAATSSKLARDGWLVFAGVRRTQDAERLKTIHENIRPLMLDVTRPETIEKAAAMIEETVGDAGLQGLVNNAGLGYIAILEHTPIEDLKANFDVNLFGLIALTQAMLPLLRKGKRRGRIVNVGSIAGLITLPYAASYFATKYALESISDTMRYELRPDGIAVSLIRPGLIDTDIFDGARVYGRKQFEDQSGRMHQKNRRGLLRMIDTAVRSGKQAPAADIVADVIARALTDHDPRPYYFDSWLTAIKIAAVKWTPPALLGMFYENFFHSAKEKRR